MVELCDGQLVDPVVVGVDDDSEAVVGDGNLDEVDVVLVADFDFGVLDRTRGVGDVGLARAEALEAAAGAGDADGDADGGVEDAELCGHRLGDREDGAGAVDRDLARQGARRCIAALLLLRDGLGHRLLFILCRRLCNRLLFIVVSAAGDGHGGGEADDQQQRQEPARAQLLYVCQSVSPLSYAPARERRPPECARSVWSGRAGSG